jgi:MFS transporter, DHA2 family, multidrug resistance protein
MSDGGAKTAAPAAPTPIAGDTAPPATLALWIGFCCMALGNFMAILDIQIVASSLREIQAGVSASADELVWIQTSYLIAEVIAIPLSGFMGRALSIRNLFTAAAIGFTVASVGCALAQNLETLVVFRVIQGFMGGFMMPTTFAAGFLLFAEKDRATVNVLMGMIMTSAPALGPVLGGVITSSLGWHWLFLINLVPGIVCAIGCFLLIPLKTPNWALLKRIDLIGLVGLAAFLGSLEIVLEEGPRQGWLASSHIALWASIASLGAVVFFWRAFTLDEPIVKLDAFTDRNFAVCAILAFTVGIGLYGSVYLQPLFLGQVRGYSAVQIGQVMFVTGVFMFISAPFARQLIVRVDPRVALLAGVLLVGGSCLLQARLTAESSFWEFFWPQAMRGCGLILCYATLSIVALGTMPVHMIQSASGLFNLTRNLGGAIGLALLSTMTDFYTVFHRTELASALNPADPMVAERLAASAARLEAAGVANPEIAAIAQQAALLHREAAVTFNNLFVVIAACLALSLLVLPFVRRPSVGAGSGGDTH